MTFEEKSKFINYVYTTIKKDPSLYKDVILACNQGQEDHISNLRKQCADMETIAVAFSSTMDGKYREKNQEWIECLLISKLEEHQNKDAFMNWESTLKQLKDKNEN